MPGTNTLRYTAWPTLEQESLVATNATNATVVTPVQYDRAVTLLVHRDFEDMLMSMGQMPRGAQLDSLEWTPAGWLVRFSCDGISQSGTPIVVRLPHGPVEPQNWPPHGQA